MSSDSKLETTQKILVNRPGKVSTDSRGRSVWTDPVETPDLELVSTQTLQTLLTSRDEAERQAIEEAARSDAEGVLARDVATGYFEIIDDNDLQAILDSNEELPALQRPAEVVLEPVNENDGSEELSLVSTQALRKILDRDGDTPATDNDDISPEPDLGGFDPYNSS